MSAVTGMPRHLALALGLLLATGMATAQDYVPIERRLSRDQLEATGLAQLSAAQLQLLNRLLREDQSSTASAAESRVRADVRREPEARASAPVESRIAGTFRGWSHGTTLTLENGEQWRVVEGDLHARPTESPRVTIKPGLISGWYMKVDGHSQSATVRRVK